MAEHSEIGWTDATWNPVRGCSRVSPGCVNCYAESLTARWSGGWGKGFAEQTPSGPRWTRRVELIPHMLDRPLRWKRPRRIFVNSLSDLFHESLSDEAIAAVFGVMAACPQHIFQVLTKRPERAAEWFEWLNQDAGRHGLPLTSRLKAHAHYAGVSVDDLTRTSWPGWPLPNAQLGCSVENQETAEERIPHLLRCPAAVHFVSYEPALGPIDFRWAPWDDWSPHPRRKDQIREPVMRDGRLRAGSVDHLDGLRMLDWIIAGGESGRNRRPCEVEWFQSVADQCSAARVPFFMKQDGGPRPGQQGRIPAELWARKEMPSTGSPR